MKAFVDRCLGVALAVLAVVSSSGASAQNDKVLNIYNWAEYIGENTVRQFERETGIRVRYDNFDSNEVLLVKMVAGRTGYNIVVPSSDFGRLMVDGGLVQRLDRSLLSNWGNSSAIKKKCFRRCTSRPRSPRMCDGATTSISSRATKRRPAGSSAD